MFFSPRFTHPPRRSDVAEHSLLLEMLSSLADDTLVLWFSSCFCSLLSSPSSPGSGSSPVFLTISLGDSAYTPCPRASGLVSLVLVLPRAQRCDTSFLLDICCPQVSDGHCTFNLLEENSLWDISLPKFIFSQISPTPKDIPIYS